MSPSLLDLDQGGIARRWIPEYMGPSIGWIRVPAEAGCIFPITALGAWVINRSITLVTINVAGLGAGAVSVLLPVAAHPAVSASVLPGNYAQRPVTIVDVGGNASNITILPQAGENIMGLASLLLTSPFGGYTLMPIPELLSWSTMSP